MLPKANRLKKKKDFERVFKKGKGYKEDFLYLKVVKNNLKNSRFGFAVSKKISKKATIRNQTKRRLRELVRVRVSRIKNGIDGVIVVMPGLEKKDFWEMESMVDKLFMKAGILEIKK